MKKITFLILLITSTMISAQNGTVDFESGGQGDSWTWTVDQNDSNPPLEIVDNPNTAGLNTSAKVAKFTAKAAGNDWALVISDDIGSFTFDDTNSLVKLMVRKDIASNVGVKFEGPGGVFKEIKVASSVTNGDWEELTFDFKTEIGVTYNKLVIIPDFDTRSQDNIVYFDNLSFNAQPADTVNYNLEPIDFEDDGFGANFTWTVDQNDSNPPLEIVANPKTNGANTSAKVAKFTAKDAGNDWALVISDNVGSFTFDDTNSIVKIMVKKDVASDVGVKFEGPANAAKEIKVANSVTNGDWEELTFDFTSEIGVTYNKLVIIPDFAARSQDNIVYFDNLTFNAKADDTNNGNTNVVTVDPAAAWIGYMTVTNTSDGFEFQDFWGFADLKSSFDGQNIVLQPNFSTYAAALNGNDNDRAYWTNSSDGGATAGDKGNKNMQASSFVEPGDTFNGKDLTFQGTISSNTLSSDYTAKFFIKALDPSNSYIDVFNGSKVMDLPASGNFSISATASELPAGLVIQYGFEIKGLNANPDDETALGSIIIEPNTTLSTETINQISVSAYPNPSKSNWTISTQDSNIEAIEVYNLLGKKVFVSTEIGNRTVINSNGLSQGVYLAKIKTDRGQMTLKLIKE